MASTERQNRLLLAEDWKRVYQSFKYADFQSYDFDNLRRTMINYIRQNYPEDFNDYIESSEYLALIDLIAFLGQNLAFRADLNARENYLETADRRESVLRLARLISYNVKRNQPASGLLKIESISTTENIIDSNGLNLSTQSVLWNDSTNGDWFEQFTRIMNAALPVTNKFGRPIKIATIQGVTTEQYRFNSNSANLPVFGFNKPIDSQGINFEVVSANIDDESIYEEAPLPSNRLGFLYRDDGQGPGSNNTGFFFHFRQGKLKNNTFEIATSVPNTTINIDNDNINNSDVWLYKLDSNGAESELWEKVDNVEGNNIIYNSVSKGIRNIFTVLTRINDQISLIFSDGTFGEIPKGNFRAYYRESANIEFTATPNDLFGINIKIPYVSATGKTETVSMTLALQETISNAATSESSDSIKQNAPATYYTQNRLITGEDYNIGALNVLQDIIKTKAINRTSSGISRYYDLRDATGKYSNTLLFGNDGILFKEVLDKDQTFDFITKTDIEGVIENTIEPMLRNTRLKNYYYDNFPRNEQITNLNIVWNLTTFDTNRSTGLFLDSNDFEVQVSSFTTSILKFVEPGSLIKFTAPDGYHFMEDNTLMLGAADHLGARDYIWVKVISVEEDGTVISPDTGLGPIVLNDRVPTGCKIQEIIPIFNDEISVDVSRQLVDQIFAYKTFGLRYDVSLRQWRIIINENLNVADDFSLGKQGDVTGETLDSSWLLLFETDGRKYNVKSRGTRYVFESADDIRFFYDSSDRIYDSKTGRIVKDTIKVLNINNQPDSLSPFTVDWTWKIDKEFKNVAGYINSKKIELSFFDSDDDGVVDDPDVFEHLIAPSTNSDTKYIFEKKAIINRTETYNYISATEANIAVIASESVANPLSQWADGKVFYIPNRDVFLVYNQSANKLEYTNQYKAFVGRDNLKFEYSHAADENARIDPSSSNLIDVYLLTQGYDTNYRNWLQGKVQNMPLPPSNDQLFLQYGQDINKIKSISDDVIYHPTKYKPLFGSKADVDLQASFKVVKNSGRVVNDNDVKSRVIDAINTYFALENWDFGETFYFQELAAYITNQLAPDIVSIVIVPTAANQVFGSLFEIKSENDEIFVSAATVDDVEIIDAITASRLQANGEVVTSDQSLNTGVQSESADNGVIITSTGNY